MRLAAPAILATLCLLSGCLLDRSGLGSRSEDASVGLDAGGRSDGGGSDGGRDGGCAAGTVDLDLDPTNGCECVVMPQGCSGGDEDCDGMVDEGCDCAPVGATRPCGRDTPECVPGTQTCEPGGTWGACEGAIGPTRELCNGLDDDCDGTVDAFSEPCGTTDVGTCTLGTRTCTDGSWGPCDAIEPAAADKCATAGDDEDCDGVVDEDCECFGSETTACTLSTCSGVRTCSDGRYGPCVVSATETCDGIDDDCNGVVDDGTADCEGATGCAVFRHAGITYLMCFADDERRSWSDARDRCRSFGYELATIDDMAENDALAMEADSLRAGDWWIGIHDTTGDGDFGWVGSSTSYTNWRGSPSSGDCGVLDSERLDWETKGCGGGKPFICEAPRP